MLVKNLLLRNYRNYTNALFTFDPHLNIITGRNGIGKTNILESLIVTANTKSFRTLNDQDLIKKEEDYLRINVESDQHTFKIVISKDGKGLYLNNQLIKKTSEFIGKLNAILFKPGDLELFNQSPKERRKLIDLEIGKVSPEYLDALLRYNLLLKDKNRLLKEATVDQTLLTLIEESMVPLIKILIEGREEFFEKINEKLTVIYQTIANSNDQLEIVYKKCSDCNDVYPNIVKNREKDAYYHYAVFGPHHEDYSFHFNGFEINSIASQGQKRMCLIAFKLALVSYIEEKTGEKPLILLDDILSELDIDNQRRLLNILPEDYQIIITNTDNNRLENIQEYKLIELKEEEHV